MMIKYAPMFMNAELKPVQKDIPRSARGLKKMGSVSIKMIVHICIGRAP